MKQKKPSSLTRILGYAGGHKNLTILGCILSALSAVLGLAPYLCVWLVARSILAAWPSLDGAGDLDRFGWMAVWFAIGSILLYFAALMSTHIAAFRTARNIRRAAMTHVLKLPLGFRAGVIVAVPLHEVNAAPNAKSCAKRDYQSLQYVNCAVEKIHINLAFCR